MNLSLKNSKKNDHVSFCYLNRSTELPDLAYFKQYSLFPICVPSFPIYVLSFPNRVPSFLICVPSFSIRVLPFGPFVFIRLPFAFRDHLKQLIRKLVFLFKGKWRRQIIPSDRLIIKTTLTKFEGSPAQWVVTLQLLKGALL